MSYTQDSDKGTWVRNLIEEFIQSSENTLGNSANDKAFGAPIVGYARGDDPIFEEFKTDIGAFYLTPSEVFEKAYPGSGARSDELTVISWILPHIKKTKMDNRKENAYPS
jgi:epoxyqueuosine reductase